MAVFSTFNQFDSRFKEVGNFGKDCSACPFFSLISAFNFMQNSEIETSNHETAIYDAISSYITHEVPKYLAFEELLQFTAGTLNPSDIGASTPELVVTGVVGWEHFFPVVNVNNYCVIFLKNSNFFVIMVKRDGLTEGEGGVKYAVRDCHQNEQYDFDNFDDMVKHLNTDYRFEESTIVDGVPIPEFDNIEFLVINKPFQIII